MMKVFPLVIFLLSCTSMFGQDVQNLVIWLPSGERIVYALDEEPVTRFTGTDLVLSTRNLTVDYPLSSLQRYTYELNAEVSRDLLLPVRLGFSLCDDEGKELQSYVSPVSYQSASTWSFRRLENVFEGLEQSKEYVCYPTVKFGDVEFRVTPPVEIEPDSCMCPDGHHPHMIDLGLSVKWACCNVGASSPEEYGGYYAWGETEEKSYYGWNTYKYCNGSWDTLTKYCTNSSYGTVDNKTVLEPGDDVAHVKWGGSWRMPTKSEIDELINKCSWTWTTQNGVNGYVVTSRVNGNSIFLPAAGVRWDEGVYNSGSYGDCWSASLDESGSGVAYNLSFGSGYRYLNGNRRNYGFSVRPVTE